jgi:hypothetical protein
MTRQDEIDRLNGRMARLRGEIAGLLDKLAVRGAAVKHVASATPETFLAFRQDDLWETAHELADLAGTLQVRYDQYCCDRDELSSLEGEARAVVAGG